jgi:hypothetical protein
MQFQRWLRLAKTPFLAGRAAYPPSCPAVAFQRRGSLGDGRCPCGRIAHVKPPTSLAELGNMKSPIMIWLVFASSMSVHTFPVISLTRDFLGRHLSDCGCRYAPSCARMTQLPSDSRKTPFLSNSRSDYRSSFHFVHAVNSVHLSRFSTPPFYHVSRGRIKYVSCVFPAGPGTTIPQP